MLEKMDPQSGPQLSSTEPAGNQPTRREFLQGTLAVAGSMLAESMAAGKAPAQAAGMPAKDDQPGGKRPNLVFFLGEGQRWDALSLMGNTILKTPNHDRIGSEGMVFRNAFCTNALCAPARAALLTGMYSRATGALSNEHMDIPLPSDIPLFTDLLRQAGYEIAIVGKVHVHNGVEERNWNYYFGHNSPGNNYANPFFKEGRDGKVGEERQYENVYPDDLATDRAIEWLKEDRGAKPFCLLVWFVAPHEPFFRARRHFDLYRGTEIPKPATFDDDLKGYPGKPGCFAAAQNKIGTTPAHESAGSLEGMAKDYYAGLVAVDDNIGKVLTFLEEQNILDETAIIHSSDHGFFLGEWRLFDKRLMHEPSIRVPMMIRYPKRIPAGVVREEQVLDLDVAPTILDLAGITAPAYMEGKSMLPLIRAANPDFRKEWYYEYYEWPNPEGVRPHRGIRTEQHKLIHYGMDPQEFEMYDLAADPGEINNLYGNPHCADVQTKLWGRMQELQEQVPQRPKIEPRTASS
jgi:arylsulfatase A-like enzyme